MMKKHQPAKFYGVMQQSDSISKLESKDGIYCELKYKKLI